MGFYNFAQNLNDTGGAGRNGTAIGSGPLYVSGTPSGVTNSFCVSSTAWSTNGATLPNTLFPTGTTGSVGLYFYLSQLQPVGNTFVPFDSIGTNGRLGLEITPETAHMQENGTLGLNMPFAGGGERDAGKPFNWNQGRWYRVVLTWSGTTVKLLCKDISQGVYTTVYSGTMGGTYAPGTTSNIYIGKYEAGSGNDWPGYLSGLLITDQYCPTGDDALLPTAASAQWLVNSWGASMMQGFCGSSNENGIRTPMQVLAQQLGINLFAAGTSSFNIDSTILAPYTDAVAGNNSTQFTTRFHSASPAYGSLQFQSGTSQTCYLYMADLWLNDHDQGVALTVSAADEYDFLTTTAQRGSRVVFTTAIQTLRFTTPGIYETPEVAAYNGCTGVAAIYGNVICYDAWHAQTTTSDCGDSTHPSANSYGALAAALEPLIVATNTPTVTPTATPTPTATVTPTFTNSPTPTATNTPCPLCFLNDRRRRR
jgi:hypothetical protein